MILRERGLILHENIQNNLQFQCPEFERSILQYLFIVLFGKSNMFVVFFKLLGNQGPGINCQFSESENTCENQNVLRERGFELRENT